MSSVCLAPLSREVANRRRECISAAALLLPDVGGRGGGGTAEEPCEAGLVV